MKRKDLTKGSVPQHIFALALPMMFGVFSIMAFNLIDTYFIGQLGTQALAAFSFTFPVIMIVGSLSFGMTMALTSMVSRLMGEKNEAQVKQTVSDALCFALLIVLIISALGQLTLDWVFQALGAKDALMPMIRDYMQIWYYSIIFLLIPMLGNGAIRGLGDTFFPAMVMLVAATVNAIFDPIFIFGHFGFPAMGIKGAAYATVVSRIFTLIASMLVLHYREQLLVRPFKNIAQSLQHIKDFIGLSIPAALNIMVVPVSIAIITKMVASYGDYAIAGFGVASKIESFIAIPIVGISAGLGPYVGQNYGAQYQQRVRQGIRFAHQSSAIALLLIACFCIFFSNDIAAFFSDDPQVVQITRAYIDVVSISYIFLAFLANINSSLIAIGNAKMALWITLLRMVFLYIPLAYFLRHYFDLLGIFYAASLSNIIAGLLAFNLIKKKI